MSMNNIPVYLKMSVILSLLLSNKTNCGRLTLCRCYW